MPRRTVVGLTNLENDDGGRYGTLSAAKFAEVSAQQNATTALSQDRGGGKSSRGQVIQ
jgi:hypothetical protein